MGAVGPAIGCVRVGEDATLSAVAG